MSRVLALAIAGLFSASAWAAPPAAVPGGDSFIGEMIAILLPLVFIIAGLLFLLRLLRRRYGLSGSDSPLSVLQILPVGPRERVVLVKSRAGRVFAIGVGAQSVTFITDLDIGDVAPESTTAVDPAPRSPSNIDGVR
ncbi:flagellar biosynthetic protein FliO [Luteimonas sp. WGS1318]|uniref:flagellar biosynthetic protein FliO n=1 Tax=Luteimonas sp. WGS1318 TaxID=3366815 RepID=UPI00372D12A4